MKILHFDLVGGISGDMVLAAFLDAGLPFKYLQKELGKLGVKGFVLRKSLVRRGHIRAIKLTVVEQDGRSRSLSEILRVIEKSRLSKEVKILAAAIYKNLAAAESRVHHHKGRDITFEELGRLDSLVDIAGAAIAIKYFQADQFSVSVIPVSKKVAPATMELLKGFKLQPVDFDYETITPTGAAILKTLKASPAGSASASFTLEKIGTGAGTFNPAYISNVLRIMLGSRDAEYAEDQVMVVESNIDDMSPQVFGYLEEELFKAGAKEVYVQPVQMKKFRPGFLLTVLTAPTLLDKVLGIIFRETTTFGIRFFPARRKKILRQIKVLNTRIGKCRVKIGSLNSSVKTISPEYEDCKRLAKNSGLAFRSVYERIKNEGIKKWHFPV